MRRPAKSTFAFGASLPKFAIAESPRFHSHSLWRLFAPVPVGILNFNGCCHLGTELNGFCCQKRTFLADLAVNRTRRLAIHPTF